MATFKDATGREWDVTITIGAYRRLKAQTSCDLDVIAKDTTQLVALVFGGPSTLLPVMDVLLAPQIKALGGFIPPDDHLHDAFDPATVERFGDAFLDAVIDFLYLKSAPEVKALLAEALTQLKHAPAGAEEVK